MQKLDMDNKEYIIGIDIGSSNVTMAVGTRKESGDIAILGVEVQKVEGCVKDGDVTNFILLGDAIAQAKSALETELGLQLNSAYVGISGRSVYCVSYEDYVNINEQTGCVTDLELRELNARIGTVVSGSGDDIIDRILLGYCIDERQDVADPLGAYGRKLSVKYLFVMAAHHNIDRVNRALHRASIVPLGICVSPTLLPDLLLTPDEKEEGVAIVDIGGDLTDLVVVREGKLRYFASLPIGSSAINTDLQTALRIPKRDIDGIKHRYGSAIAAAVPEDAAIPIKAVGRQSKRTILHRNVAEIAEERLKDVAQFIMRELRAAKYSTKIPCGIVLTGGASYLANIDQLFASELNMEVRSCDLLNGLDDESQEKVCAKPQSVAIGLLLYGAKHAARSAGRTGINVPPVPPTRPVPPTPPVPPTRPTPPTPPVPPTRPTPPVPPTRPVPPTPPVPPTRPTPPVPPTRPTPPVPPTRPTPPTPPTPPVPPVPPTPPKPPVPEPPKPVPPTPPTPPKRSWLEKLRERLDGAFASDDKII